MLNILTAVVLVFAGQVFAIESLIRVAASVARSDPWAAVTTVLIVLIGCWGLDHLALKILDVLIDHLDSTPRDRTDHRS